MRANSLRIVAVLLIVVGIGVALLGYLRATAPEPVDVTEPSREGRDSPIQRVVVASRAIEAGALIEASDIEISKRPGGQSEGAAQLLSSPGDALGRRTRVKIAKGEEFTSDLLARPVQTTPLATAVSPGHRALAIEVNEIEAAGGYLAPGDRVDLVWFLDHRDAGAPFARTLVRKVRVLAFGEVLDREAPPEATASAGDEAEADDSPDGGPFGQGEEQTDFDRQPRARSVVLELGDEQVSRVLLASRTGQIRLAVHSSDTGAGEGSEGQAEDDRESLDTLVGAARSEPEPKPAQPVEPAPETVRVFKGRDSRAVEVE